VIFENERLRVLEVTLEPEIRPSAERASFTPEDSHVRHFIPVESHKGPIHRLSMFGIDGVAHLGARNNDCQHTIGALDANRHRYFLR
jgi:hypothetical protein